MDGIELTFTEGTTSRTAPDGTVSTLAVILPALTLKAPLAGIIEPAKREAVRGILEQKPDDIDIGPVRFEAPQITSQRQIALRGNFKAEKWWKMTGFCCHWFKCKKCEWKGRIFERTVRFTATLGNVATQSRLNPEPHPAAPRTIGTEPVAVLPAHTAASLTITAAGKSDDDRSDLEKAWDWIGGLLEALGRLFDGKETLQLEDFLGKAYQLEDQSIDPPNVANRKIEAFAYDSQVVEAKLARPYESRDLWEAFNAGLYFSSDRTGFFSDRSTNTISMHYAFDYERYTEALNSSELGERLIRPTKGRKKAASNGKGGIRFDMLDKALCSAMRPAFEDYVDSLAKKFNGEEQKAEEIAYSSRIELVEKLREKYVLSGTEELFRRPLRRRERETSSSERKVQAPSVAELANDRWTMPAQGNLWSVARQNGWSPSERKCAAKVAERRSKNRGLVFPLQSFSECATDSAARLLTLFQSIEQRYGVEIFTPFRAAGGVIAGDSFYRGWYYCYQNPSICAGSQRVTWWTEPSKYNSRGGNHKGLDLIHGSPNEVIPLVAAVDGQIVYHNKDPSGWGHALIIPFEKDDQKYLLVYAHLPPQAKRYDGKRVKVGDSLGQAGCTGNAGDGKGACNNYCRTSDSFRASDIHLHVELLKKTDAAVEAVDPLTVVPLAIKPGPPRRLYVCQGEALAIR